MKIQLEDWKVRNLIFAIKNNKRKTNSFGLSIGRSLLKEDPKGFVIAFKIAINDKEFSLKLEMIFNFRTDEELDENYLESDFFKINAPAIAFPYVRSYISNLTLQSGFNPIILPSVNFVHLAKDSESKKEIGSK